jgi:hypothetical protein
VTTAYWRVGFAALILKVCIQERLIEFLLFFIPRGVATGEMGDPDPRTLFFRTKFVILSKLRRNWGAVTS